MVKYYGRFFDGHSTVDVVCDNLYDFRRELVKFRKLKASSKNSINPIIEFDCDDFDGELCYEFRRLYNASSMRVILRG